jgi:hypothetical protein
LNPGDWRHLPRRLFRMMAALPMMSSMSDEKAQRPGGVTGIRIIGLLEHAQDLLSLIAALILVSRHESSEP